MGLLAFGLLVVGGTVFLSIVGLLLSRKVFSHTSLQKHNEVADPMLSVIGTLYAVLLGLLVVQAMSDFQKSRLTVESEAVALADTFRLAVALPPPVRENLQKSCISYASAVINKEWADMEREETCQEAWEAIDKMWWDVISFSPNKVKENYVYPELLAAAKKLNDNRRSRLVSCRTWVSPVLWIVLIVGAIFTIIFTYSFGVENVYAHVFMTTVVAITLSLNIFLWAIYSNPFYGLLRVTPEAFEMDLEHFEFYLNNPDEQRWNKQKAGSIHTIPTTTGKWH